MATSASASASSRGIISPSERQFLIEGIRHNVRRDGRGRLDFRFIDIECGVFPQANGSARLKLEQAGTDVIACVKAEVGTPMNESPAEGNVECNVQCWASGGIHSTMTDKDMEIELRHTLRQTLLAKGALDKKQLCIIEGHTCWTIYVDVIVLSSGGSLADAVTLAAHSALNSTLLPSINVNKVLRTEDGTSSKAKVVEQSAESFGNDYGSEVVSSDAAEAAAASGKELVGGISQDRYVYQLEVDDDPSSGWMLEAHNVPVAVTLWQVDKKAVVDASLDEESCSEASIVVSISKSGDLVSIITRTQPSFPPTFGCVEPQALESSINAAKAIADILFERVDSALQHAKGKISQKLDYYINEIRSGHTDNPLLRDDSTLSAVQKHLNDDEIAAVSATASNMTH